jgi:hypothetical protein
MNWLAYLLFLCGAFQLPPQLAQLPARPALTVSQARRLVTTALKSQGVPKRPGFTVQEFNDRKFPQFYMLGATWRDPSRGNVVENLAVDRITGDVWDASDCHEWKSRGLRKAQKELRKEIGLSSKEYRVIRRPGPMCSPDDRVMSGD